MSRGLTRKPPSTSTLGRYRSSADPASTAIAPTWRFFRPTSMAKSLSQPSQCISSPPSMARGRSSSVTPFQSNPTTHPIRLPLVLMPPSISGSGRRPTLSSRVKSTGMGSTPSHLSYLTDPTSSRRNSDDQSPD